MKKFSKVFFLILGFAVLLSGCTFLEKEELHNGLVINLPSNNKGRRSAVEFTDLFSTFEIEEVSLYTVTLTNGKQTFQGQGEPGEQILISNIPAGHWTLTSYAWVGNQWDGYEAAGKNNPKDIVIKPYTVVTEDVALVKIAFISGKQALVSETIEITENTSFIANECDVTFKRAEGFDGDIFHVAEGAVLNLIGMDDEEWFYIYVDGSSEEFVNGRLVTVEGTLNATNVYFMNNKASSNADNPNSGSAIQVEAGGTLHMEECIVKENSIVCPGIGAGIYLKDGSTSYLYDVTLYNNTVLDGDY
ncbi:MAG: hypothetical protein MJ176_00775 [Treponema sp.]|nr:hypothetical protein [Treponema sp.]